MSYSVVGSNYFAGFMEWDELKYAYLGLHTLITVFGPALLSLVIWYESYGCDANYRTLVNILLSHTCWINLLRCLIIRIPHVVTMLLAPHSHQLCNGLIFIVRFDYLCLVVEV